MQSQFYDHVLLNLLEFDPALSIELRSAGGFVNKEQIAAIVKHMPDTLLLVRTNASRVLIRANQCQDYLDMLEKQQQQFKAVADIVYNTYGYDRCERLVKHSKELQSGVKLTVEDVKLRMELCVPGYDWVRDVSIPS